MPPLQRPGSLRHAGGVLFFSFLLLLDLGAEIHKLNMQQECTAGEQSLERMRCFRRFQELVAQGVDQWCRQADVSEELLLAALNDAAEQLKGGRETCRGASAACLVRRGMRRSSWSS